MIKKELSQLYGAVDSTETLVTTLECVGKMQNRLEPNMSKWYAVSSFNSDGGDSL